MKITMTQKNKPNKPRNWLAIHAHNKTSAGPMKSIKRQTKKSWLKEEEDMDTIELNYFLRGFSTTSDQLIEEILIYPTPEQIEKLIGETNTYDCYLMDPKQIKEILGLDIDEELEWMFETESK